MRMSLAFDSGSAEHVSHRDGDSTVQGATPKCSEPWVSPERYWGHSWDGQQAHPEIPLDDPKIDKFPESCCCPGGAPSPGMWGGEECHAGDEESSLTISPWTRAGRGCFPASTSCPPVHSEGS